MYFSKIYTLLGIFYILVEILTILCFEKIVEHHILMDFHEISLYKEAGKSNMLAMLTPLIGLSQHKIVTVVNQRGFC